MKYFKKFLRDQRGVSPVIGVILMVAITVVMGAVVASFAYGYFGNVTQTPNVVLSVIDDPNDSGAVTASLLIRHSGGETIAADDWKCSITAGKEAVTDFTYQTQTGDYAMSTGTTLDVTDITTDNSTNIVAGWYHVVAVHVPSDAILLDTNVLVR